MTKFDHTQRCDKANKLFGMDITIINPVIRQSNTQHIPIETKIIRIYNDLPPLSCLHSIDVYMINENTLEFVGPRRNGYLWWGGWKISSEFKHWAVNEFKLDPLFHDGKLYGNSRTFTKWLDIKDDETFLYWQLILLKKDDRKTYFAIHMFG